MAKTVPSVRQVKSLAPAPFMCGRSPREGFVRVKTEELFGGWLVRLLPGMMQKTLDTSLQKWLETLKQKAEEELAR